MSQWHKKINRRKSTPKSIGRKHRLTDPRMWRLEDRTVPTVFSNPAAITIVDAGTTTPSLINVTGLNGQVVTNVTVTFNGLTHGAPVDIDAMLVAPDGTHIYLMSDAGGTFPVAGVNLTFSDTGALGRLTAGQIVTGSYQPTNLAGNTDVIPGAPTTPEVTTFQAFDGVSANNGAWTLYINDDEPGGGTGNGTITGGWSIDITSRVNAAPVANPDTFNIQEDSVLSPAAPGLLGNDTDADGDPRTAFLVSGPSNGVLTGNTINTNGTFTYTPTGNFAGSDSFTYRIYDGIVFSAPATVTINIANVNDTPTAVVDTYTVQNGGPQTIHAVIGVTSNDVDPDGAVAGTFMSENFQAFALQPWTTGAGTGADGGDGTDWTPSLPFGWVRDNGTTPMGPPKPGRIFTPEFFGWNILDTNSWEGDQIGQQRTVFTLGGATNHGQVLVVDGDAYEDNVETDPNLMNSYIITPAVSIGGVVAGSLKLDFDNSFRPEYGGTPPNPTHRGEVDVSYDGGSTWTNILRYDMSNTPNGDLMHANEHLTLDLNPTPGASTAKFRFGYLEAGNDWWWAIDNVKVIGNRTNTATLTANMVTNVAPAAGSVVLNANGSFVYTPAAGFTGAASFTYTISDGVVTSSPATVNLTVNANNTPPVAVADPYTVFQGQVLTVGYSNGLLLNDSDVDIGGSNVGLSAVLVAGPTPAQGILTLNPDGSFVFTPSANFFGAATFTYKANDGSRDSNTVTVAITVIQTNLNPPVANNDPNLATAQNTPLTVAAPGVLGNDTDADGNPLTAQLLVGPSHGTLTFNPDGSFVYTPFQFYNGTDTFTYRASDGSFFSQPATATITISAANVAPRGNADFFTTPLGTALSTTAATGVLRNDQDDGPIVTVFATETFESLALGPFVSPTESNGDGTDWTSTLPAGWTRDNTNTPIGNPIEFQGWNAFDVDSWVATEGNQSRANFTRGGVGAHGTVFVADGDAYDDGTDIGATFMTTYLITPSMPLGSIQTNSLSLEFDSSFRPEGLQNAAVEVSYDGGTIWNSLLVLNTANSGGNGNNQRTNEHLTVDAFNPAGVTNAVFRFKYNGDDDWWWAIDNVRATGRSTTGATLTAINYTQPAHGAVVGNANGSFTYTPTAGYRGIDQFTYQPRDGVNTGNVTTVTVIVGSQVGVQVDDGNAQRSMVRSATVYFAGTPTFLTTPAAAFTLTGPGGTAVPFSVLGVEQAGSLTAVRIGNFTGPLTQNTSLVDGRYTLTALSGQITVGGAALDGDNNGTPGGDSVNLFHRFYGDVDGNARVDIADFSFFSPAYLQGPAANNQYFDFNLDGRIDIADFSQFSVRYFTTLP